jgi:uncharacterized small protein (TIGR04563 family)
MSKTADEKCKKSFYLTEKMSEEIRAEADRLQRPISWVVQKAWRIARAEIKTIPSEDGD